MDLRDLASKLTIDEVAELLAQQFAASQRLQEAQQNLSETMCKLEAFDAQLNAQAVELQDLRATLQEKDRLLDWFRKQLFGAKSERRILDLLSPAEQLWLGQQMLEVPETPPPPPTTVKGYERVHRKAPTNLVDSDSRLRFDEKVPVEEIVVPNPELDGLPAEQLEQISEEITYRLAQRSSYVVLKYVRPVVKRLDTGELSRPAAPPAVIEKSVVDVSLLAGLVVDKFAHHLPLYRQHQRMEQAGVYLDRGTLTRLVHRVGELLEPVYLALLSSVLLSRVLTVDESPTPAGRTPRQGREPGKMKTGYFWAFYGELKEVAFLFSPTRARKVLDEALGAFAGVLLCDGYSAYESYVRARSDVIMAHCWAHARRYFLDAEKLAPRESTQVLLWLQELYRVEERARGDLEMRRRLRQTESRPIVDKIFVFLQAEVDSTALLPSNSFVKAAQYVLSRKTALQVFLDDPAVPIDTNHVERSLRPPAIGRKNWMFHVTEVGARHAAIFYSLIQSCLLQGVDPTTYLVDVLQRIDTHPAADVDLLTPRLWCEHFASQPMRSDLERLRYQQ